MKLKRIYGNFTYFEQHLCMSFCRAINLFLKIWSAYVTVFMGSHDHELQNK